VPRRRSNLRVAVLANRRVVGEAVAFAIGQQAGVRVVVGSTQPTRAGSHARTPDLVIVLGGQADGSTAAATAASRRRWPRSTIVATADSNQEEEGLALLQRGADAWLSRSQGLEDLRSIVTHAAAGVVPTQPPAVLARMTQLIRAGQGHDDRLIGRLTSREGQVLACLTAGLTRTETAQTLEISPQTVRTHLQHILRKLEVHSVREAVAIGLDKPSADDPAG
jgi:DNA-binding NarL/FixJ family response regulator